MATNELKCNKKFIHPDAPRPECELPAGPDGLCIFHSYEPTLNFIQLLEQEVSKPDHWLEGAQIKQHLSGVCLSRANLPKASFEGLTLTNVDLTDALLEEANFRSTVLEGTLLNGSNLCYAAFDTAKLKEFNGNPVDLRNADLGGASFTGSNLKSLRLMGVRFSAPTMVTPFLKTPCFEMKAGLWDKAAAIYSVLGKRAADDWDFDSTEHCSYLAMTCQHRKVIKSGPLPKKHQLLNWVILSLRAGPVGLFWLFHRAIWGYGLRPMRILISLFLVIFIFWMIFFITSIEPNSSEATLMNNLTATNFNSSIEQSNSVFIDTLILSLATFVTLGSYDSKPSGIIGELAGTVEALLGIILLDMFLIALAGKYLRRF